MLTEDYIMRIISQALAVIMTALGLKKSGKYQEALQSFDQAKEVLTGMHPRIVDQLDDAALLELITSLDRLDLERLNLLADIYREEGEVYLELGQNDNSVFAFHRSLRLYLEFTLASEGEMNREIIQTIENLRHKIDLSYISGETCLAMLDYFDRLINSSDDDLKTIGVSRMEIHTDYEVIRTKCDIG